MRRKRRDKGEGEKTWQRGEESEERRSKGIERKERIKGKGKGEGVGRKGREKCGEEIKGKERKEKMKEGKSEEKRSDKKEG